MSEQKEDLVNHPKHYQLADGKEVIDYLEMLSQAFPKSISYSMTNAFKYISRAPRKGVLEQDIRKAIFYINHALNTIRVTTLQPEEVVMLNRLKSPDTFKGEMRTFFSYVSETYPETLQSTILEIGEAVIGWFEEEDYEYYPSTTLTFLLWMNYALKHLLQQTQQ